MSSLNFENTLFKKYLDFLEIDKQKPSFSYLQEIIKAQFAKIPFENISKLFYKKRIKLSGLIDFDLYLKGIEKYNFGGTCYAVNYYLNQLLIYLGFNVKLCGADMTSPDVHLVNILTIEGKDYLIDAGYAAPFINPLPLFLNEDQYIKFGHDHYIFKKKDDDGNSKMEFFREGILKHTYRINPDPRNIKEFDHVIKDSFESSSTFMNTLLLARYEIEHSLLIHNNTVKEAIGTNYLMHSIDTRQQLFQFIEDQFNIPLAVVRESLNGIQFSGDAWT